ncbi:MAG: hypothetical protein JW726_00450 [Anaerolineales bacterium]|nr:hypothetical protein [Anaerolineales bacterium]
MSELTPADFPALYAGFDAPISALDCGERCAPYNEQRIPFCCDTRHAIPSAYLAEWDYLQAHTGLWHPWQAPQPRDTARLASQAAPNQVLIECQGHTHCQRSFRSLTCRAFPFFPYLTREGEFIGLSYYWEYEDRCWVISNLQSVSTDYLAQFVHTFDKILSAQPQDRQSYRYHATVTRRVFSRHKRAITLLHRNGNAYKVSPGSGRLRRVAVESLPKFGPYATTAWLTFPDEA